jgi:hypothetical protein
MMRHPMPQLATHHVEQMGVTCSRTRTCRLRDGPRPTVIRRLTIRQRISHRESPFVKSSLDDRSMHRTASTPTNLHGADPLSTGLLSLKPVSRPLAGMPGISG